MSTSTIGIGSRTQLSGASAALTSLASATYVVLGIITFASSGKVPLGCKLEVYLKPGTVSGNKQVSIFAQESLDGTNFGTGPISGTSNTDQPNLRPIGTIPCNTNSALQRNVWELASKFGGQLPHSAKIIALNETGATLSATGGDNDCYYQFGNGDTT